MESPMVFVLEKGEAKRQLEDMNEQERREVSDRIFRQVTERAASVGQVPVTLKTHRLQKKGLSFAFQYRYPRLTAILGFLIRWR
jgi:hypothetical protein